jgi:hypothetical protein
MSLEISGFEKCELVNNDEIREYIENNVPSEHLVGCPSIEFSPDYSLFVKEPSTLGCFNTLTHEIHINENPELIGPDSLLETVVHEIGHNVHENIKWESPHLAGKWEELYWNSDYFVSEYATTSVNEDFAECYAKYIQDPELLSFLCPEKYAFMHEYVFHASETLSFPVAWKDFADFTLGHCDVVVA